MRRPLGVVTLALALAACDSSDDGPTGPSLVGPIVFTASLLASSEVPPVTNAESGARGSVTITVEVPRDTAGNPVGPGSATFAMQVQGFAQGTPAIGAHIHPGAAGVNGIVIVNTALSLTAPMIMADGTANLVVTVPISQELAAQILANPAGYYFNVHTPLNPGGAIRGQLARVR